MLRAGQETEVSEGQWKASKEAAEDAEDNFYLAMAGNNPPLCPSAAQFMGPESFLVGISEQ